MTTSHRIATVGDVRSRLSSLIDRCPNLNFLVLTKRPGNVRRMIGDGKRRENLWLYASASDQESLHAAVEPMQDCADLCKHWGLSLEPLLQLVDLSWMKHADPEYRPSHVIVGGESGPDARLCDIEWIRQVVRQCREAGVPPYVKQVGSNPWTDYYSEDDTHRDYILDRPHKIMQALPRGEFCEWDHATFGQPSPRSMIAWKPRDKKGADPSEWPQDIRVQEVPK